MKLTLTTTAFTAILGLALAGAPMTVQAQTTNAAPASASTPAAAPAPAAAKKPVKPAKTPYSGMVSAIDTTGNTISVQSTTKKDGVKTLTLSVGAMTKIKRDSKSATLAAFKVGDKVTGSYVPEADGSLTAASLNFGTAKPKKPKTATTVTTPTTATPATKPATTTPAPTTTTPAPTTPPATQ